MLKVVVSKVKGRKTRNAKKRDDKDGLEIGSKKIRIKGKGHEIHTKGISI